MNNLPKIETLHAIGKTYGRLPSDMLGIADPLTAYSINAIVFIAGMDAEERAYKKMRDGKGSDPEQKQYGSWKDLARMQR